MPAALLQITTFVLGAHVLYPEPGCCPPATAWIRLVRAQLCRHRGDPLAQTFSELQ
jgi:hypothetical protein